MVVSFAAEKVRRMIEKARTRGEPTLPIVRRHIAETIEALARGLKAETDASSLE